MLHRHCLKALLAALVFAAAPAAMAQTIDFGDDASHWANDGECDDPRFSGPGSATTLQPWDLGHDATDCRSLYRASEITFDAGGGKNAEKTMVTGPGTGAEPGDAGTSGSDTAGPDMADIDFGDDSGDWPNDDECDDIRFTGPGMAADQFLVEGNVARDARDCRALYEAGEITLAAPESDDSTTDTPAAPATTATATDIDFGDDSGGFANDGECDDPRFVGQGASMGFSSHEMHDATDCRTLHESGVVTLSNDASPDDTPAQAEPVQEVPAQTEPAGPDADEGVETPEPDASSIDFGDDSGDWPNDDECDDPRFAGEGMAYGPTLMDDNIRSDATDCRTLYEAGRITLTP